MTEDLDLFSEVNFIKLRNSSEFLNYDYNILTKGFWVYYVLGKKRFISDIDVLTFNSNLLCKMLKRRGFKIYKLRHEILAKKDVNIDIKTNLGFNSFIFKIPKMELLKDSFLLKGKRFLSVEDHIIVTCLHCSYHHGFANLDKAIFDLKLTLQTNINWKKVIKKSKTYRCSEFVFFMLNFFKNSSDDLNNVLHELNKMSRSKVLRKIKRVYANSKTNFRIHPHVMDFKTHFYYENLIGKIFVLVDKLFSPVDLIALEFGIDPNKKIKYLLCFPLYPVRIFKIIMRIFYG